MGHNVGEAAHRSTAKSEGKKEEKQIINAEMIRQVRINLEAGLFVSNMDFVRALLAEYDILQAAEVTRQAQAAEDAATRKAMNDPKTWEGIGQDE